MIEAKSIINMQGVINSEGAMAIVVFRKQSPALTILTIAPKVKAGFFYFMVTLVSRIYHPANTIQFKYK